MSPSALPRSACHSFSLGKGEVLPLDGSQAPNYSEASTTTFDSSTSCNSGEIMSDDGETEAEPAAAAAALPAPSTKNVRFGAVRQRSHNVILGDNPSVSKGPPVALGWDVLASDHIDLDEYELEKLKKGDETDSCDDDNNNSNNKASRIPAKKRYRMVRDAGHSRGSLLRVDREIRAIRNQRRGTAAGPATTTATAAVVAEEEGDRRSHPAPFFLRWMANRRAKKKDGGRLRRPHPDRCV